MMDMMMGAMSMGFMLLFVILLYMAIYVIFTYALLRWDNYRGGESGGDNQIGFKTVLYALLLVSVIFGSIGVFLLVSYLFSGAEKFMFVIGAKQDLAIILACAGLAGAVAFFFLPGTNHKEYPKSQKYFWGASAFFAGIIFLVSTIGFLLFAFEGFDGWKVIGAPTFSAMAVYGALTFLGLFRLGTLSGWKPPSGGGNFGAPPAPGQPYGGGAPQANPPTQAYPPQGGGPQGGGYPPQGGGYPPGTGGQVPPAGGGGGYGGPPPGGGGGYGGPPPAQ